MNSEQPVTQQIQYLKEWWRSHLAENPSSSTSSSIVCGKGRSYRASPIELYFFAMLIFGKCFMVWPKGFAMGYWEFFFCGILIAVHYLAFTSCIAEMASILPFSGGSYGYVRCVLGPFMGYMVGFFESVEYITFVAATLSVFGQILRTALQTSSAFEPLYWLAFYLISMIIMMLDGPYFWRFAAFLSLWLIIFIFVFCLGNSGVARMNDEAVYWPSESSFMNNFSVGGWCYKGIEIITLTSGHADKPARQIPRVLMSSVLSMIFLLYSLILILGSLQPNVHNLDYYLPLLAGTKRLFNIPDRFVSLLFAPAIFGVAYCFLFAAYRQLYAMARSGLVPAWLGKAYGQHQTPIHALVAVCVLSFAIELILFYAHNNLLSLLYNISMLSSLPVYMSLMVSYVIYAKNFHHMERTFRSPLGISGAIFAFVIFGFAVVTLALFSSEAIVSITFFFIASFCVAIYYFAVAEKRQCFSAEEQARFLRIYVSNLSQEGRRRESDNSVVSRKRKDWNFIFSKFTSFRRDATVYASST
eukprot:scaffold912_cov187-Ochromonas_danica.AAC.23